MNDGQEHKINSKSSIENHLTKQLRQGCDLLEIRFDEWDLDEYLRRALSRALHALQEYDPKMERIVATFNKYDTFYKLAEELGISIDDKFGWFFKFIKHK